MIVSSICNAGTRLSGEEAMEIRKMMEHKRCPYSVDESSLTSLTRKRQKPDFSLSPKERKEKVGERINALQQLVSPYGKTDTASVLLEAMEYIRFLHDQVKVLSAPYLQSSPMAKNNIPLEKQRLVYCSDFFDCRSCSKQRCRHLGSGQVNFAKTQQVDLTIPNDKLIEEDAELGGNGSRESIITQDAG